MRSSNDTRVALDVEGHALSITDARSNVTLSHTYCPTGAAIQTVSAEAGTSTALYNIEGTSIRGWNSLSVAVRTVFDAVRRPTHLYVKIGAATEFLAQRTLYGEGLTDSTTPNLRGRVYQVYDGAGAVTNVQNDFKGNLLQHNRVLALAYTTTVDWISIASLTNYTTIASTAASPELLRRTFGFDVLQCPKCKGRMRLLAMVTEPKSVARYLRALGDPTTSVPGPEPARGPPYWRSRVLQRATFGDEAA